jgi:hypothetical protein
MNTIPSVLQSRPTDRQDHHPSRINTDTVTHSNENSGDSGPTTIIPSPATDRIDGMDTFDSNERAEGIAEYSAMDAVEAGEEPDKTNEALIIQRAARRYLKRRNEGYSGNTLTIGRDRLFKLCKKYVRGVHATYRKIYLGPVPHLLLCVEWIVNRAQSLKDSIKAQRAKSTVLQELSDLMAQQQQMR